MTSTTPPATLDLALLHTLLDVPDHEDGRELVAAARAVSATLPQLVISVAAREGVPLGSGSSDELARARARAVRYAAFRATAEAAAPHCRVVKGPSLARHYPQGVLRPVGDLDLVLPDQAELWAAAHALATEHGAEPHELTLVTGPDGRLHVLLTLAWPSPDPLVEQELRVELSTAAFYGDLGALPVRYALPGPQGLADLLSVAEERVERPFHAKDAVDVLMLLAAGELDDTDAVTAALDTLRLAPEGLELAALVHAVAPHPLLDALAGRLRPLAAQERARRAAVPARSEPAGIRARLDAGFPVWGMLLDTCVGRGPADRLELVDGPRSTLVHTPVGSFLLVAGELVDAADHAAALAFLDSGARA
ncbi:hypothetical protein ACYTFC_30585 [Streptomyces globosus]|jgi:hypothetical protein|uniref:hypothetical protein n=1 Tax=Streptomyces globosus TaxID=68209 RepID=UPI0038116E38